VTLDETRLRELEDRVRRLPTGPGVYAWKDDAGRTLYVGKATNLRSRARTYLRGSDARPLVHLLMRRATDVEAISTDTPEEALLLENTLIKKERPPYNLRLKDDKSYLLVRVDRKHPFPRLRLVRRVKKDGARYFGPFASAKAVRSTLRFLRTLYPLRTCSDRELAERTRPCLYHQIGRCAAPCVDAIDREAYGRLVEEAIAVLRGHDEGVVRRLESEMQRASDDLHFEHAAVVRDRLRALESALERQKTVMPDGKDRDVVAVAVAGGVAMLGIVYVRDGHVVATRTWPERTGLGRRDVITAFLSTFYLRGRIVPAEILVEEEPVDREGLEEILGGVRGSKVVVRRPQRSPAADLVRMAARNAAEALAEHSARVKESHAALVMLAEVLGLGGPPARIEGYDLSHLGGDDPVAGMSVLVGGVPDTSSYRHFAIREAAGGDDYAGMREVVARRFAAGEHLGELPDLVLIDGGRGQVEAALAAFREGLGEPPAIVGMAKARPGQGQADERLILPGRDAPIILPPTHPGLRLLVRARNEAHRFAGRYQRKRRKAALTKTALDDIPGIGPARRRMLLERFGSIAGIRATAFEDLAALPGIGERRAREIRERLEEL
jgi:excinuclease ABC subunit C